MAADSPVRRYTFIPITMLKPWRPCSRRAGQFNEAAVDRFRFAVQHRWRYRFAGRFGPIAGDYDAMLMVDEAHATGVIGDLGRGVSELLYAEQAVHIRVGTLSKALGSLGGFVAGSQQLIDYLTNRARSYIYSTAMPEANAAAALQALQIAEQETLAKDRPSAASQPISRAIVAHGWWLGTSQSHIVPIVLGDPSETLRMAGGTRDQGFFVPGIRPPSVPEGESLLHISITFLHDDVLLERLANALLRCTDLSEPEELFGE